MRSRARLMRNRRGIYSLLLVIFMVSSCTREEAQITEQVPEQERTEQTFLKSTITNEVLQNKLEQYTSNTGMNSILSTEQRTGSHAFIKAIATDEIVQFSDGSITTYTMKVYTQDDTGSSYTNLVVKEENGNLSEYLVRYTPSESYIKDRRSTTTYVPFDGNITLMETDGTLLNEQVVVDGTSVASRSSGGCTITIEIIWNCAANNGHQSCTAGGNYIAGMNLIISCPSGGGGGGPGGDGSTGTNGNDGGGSTGSGGTTNLPTDPAEWNLFFDLIDLLGDEDNFYFDETLIIDPELEFDTFEEFEEFFTGTEVTSEPILQDQDGTYDLSLSFTDPLGLAPTLFIVVNSTLHDDSMNQSFQLNEISTYLEGYNPMGYNVVLDYFNFSVDNNTIITINLYLTQGIDVGIGPLKVHLTDHEHYKVKFNGVTGGFIDATKIN